MSGSDLDASVSRAARALLERVGRDAGAAVQLLAGSGNNRVFRVETTPPLLLKAYFRHALDRRDRLGAEFAVLSYAWNAGLRTLPEPLAADPEHGLGLYGFLEGRRLEADEVGQSAVDQARELFERLNDPAHRAAAAGLPVASEACFSLAAHLATVDRRVERLAGIEPATPEHLEAAALWRTELEPSWRAVRTGALAAAERLGQEPDAEIDAADRCVSPSDFGFHNALIAADGRISFLDFEYAGWDDPAKLLGDFFSQVAVAVPDRHLPAFAARLAARTSDPARHRARFDILLPVYRVKWIAIILNDFLPAGAHRRRFALGEPGENDRLATQLAKARQALERVQTSGSL